MITAANTLQPMPKETEPENLARKGISKHDSLGWESTKNLDVENAGGKLEKVLKEVLHEANEEGKNKNKRKES